MKYLVLFNPLAHSNTGKKKAETLKEKLTDGSVEFTVVADNGYEAESVTVNGIEVTLTNGKYKCELKDGVYFRVTFTESKPAPVTEKGGCNSGITATAPIIFVITALAALALIGGRKNEE